MKRVMYVLVLSIIVCFSVSCVKESQEKRKEPDKKVTGSTATPDNKEQKNEAQMKYDLTDMGSDMVYATVYQMMAYPEDYEGKKFKIRGNYYHLYDKKTKKTYYYCVIQDATACCAQGIEFAWKNKPHKFPVKDEEIVVTGTFHTYREKGDDNLYGRLEDAVIARK